MTHKLTDIPGWLVMCHDGESRHYPYINRGDAECDASVYDRPDRCECNSIGHTVIPHRFSPPQTGQA